MGTKISDLAIKHDYYCNGSNYYSNDARVEYRSWPAFMVDYFDADEDMNLCFRWDVSAHDDEKPELGYYAEIFIMGQRKGLFKPIHIERVIDEDVHSILEYLGKHWAKMQRLWCPLSIADIDSVPNPVG